MAKYSQAQTRNVLRRRINLLWSENREVYWLL